MTLLEEAMQMAKEYHDKLGPLEKWLTKTEKKVKDMEVVPTEEDQIQRRINEHEKLHDEIIHKQPSFDDVADIAQALMQVVGEENDSRLRMTSNYYSYIVWIFLMIFIVILIMTASTDDSNKVTGISYVIIAIFILLFVSYLYNKLSA
mgnify:CR=1 FL=1